MECAPNMALHVTGSKSDTSTSTATHRLLTL